MCGIAILLPIAGHNSLPGYHSSILACDIGKFKSAVLMRLGGGSWKRRNSDDGTLVMGGVKVKKKFYFAMEIPELERHLSGNKY